MASQLPIATLIELARTRTDDAARQLAMLHKASMSAQQKLQLLQQYRAEYDQQLQTLMRAGVSAAQMRNFYSFLSALDQGITTQRAAAAQSEARLDDGKGAWRQQRRMLNAFETLEQRMQRQQQIEQSRREQRASDEFASRIPRGVHA